MSARVGAQGLLLSVALWVALLGVVGAAYAMLLPACGLLPASNFCPQPSGGLSGEAERGATLARVANQLELELIRRKLACASIPPPEAPPLELPTESGPPRPQQMATLKPPPPPPPPPPPKPVEKPKPPEPSPVLKMPDKPTQDMSFLKGCWQTDPFKHQPSQTDLGVSTYCFDEKGNGRLEFKRQGREGYACRPSARAHFTGTDLVIDDSDTSCTNGGPWWADHLVCRRAGDGVAQCSGRSQENGKPTSWTVRLHRVR